MATALDPKRTVSELKELRSLTGDENGAQRVAFTPIWAKARKWLRSKVEETGAEIHNDAAGNFWATLRGKSDKALLIGGHIDSVPNGGWLDGCLNTLAGVEILRRINAQYKGKPPVTVRLVDWCDEEGARFGKSLFGSSACSGKIDMNETRKLKDKDGILLVDAVKEHGIDFEKVKDSGKELKNAAAYIELHIEQGPVLLDVGLAWERIWNIEPILFNNELIKFADDAISEIGAKPHRLPSGPLHDAAEVARAGVPTVMMFVQSLHGISHNKIEDTKEEHLELAVTAFDKLADKAMRWIG